MTMQDLQRCLQCQHNPRDQQQMSELHCTHQALIQTPRWVLQCQRNLCKLRQACWWIILPAKQQALYILSEQKMTMQDLQRCLQCQHNPRDQQQMSELHCTHQASIQALRWVLQCQRNLCKLRQACWWIILSANQQALYIRSEQKMSMQDLQRCLQCQHNPRDQQQHCCVATHPAKQQAPYFLTRQIPMQRQPLQCQHNPCKSRQTLKISGMEKKWSRALNATHVEQSSVEKE
ncbi:hypothetical protein OSTOST_03178 [Ostertagia ostertagi]